MTGVLRFHASREATENAWKPEKASQVERTWRAHRDRVAALMKSTLGHHGQLYLPNQATGAGEGSSWVAAAEGCGGLLANQALQVLSTHLATLSTGLHAPYEASQRLCRRHWHNLFPGF